jgi:hypothetical protein
VTTNQVCAKYAEKGVKLVVKMLDEDDTFVFIEGDSNALEFLGNLLLAQAQEEEDCSDFLGPHTAGNIFFSPESTKGIYIHRLPCEHVKKDAGQIK